MRDPHPGASRRWLRANGLFLALMGCGAALVDVASYQRGVGPWGTLFLGDPIVITAFEAHALASVLGLLLVLHAGDRDPRWHLVAAAIECILGAANLIWFDIFRLSNAVPMGVAVTCVHAIFVVAQLRVWVHLRVGRPTPRTART